MFIPRALILGVVYMSIIVMLSNILVQHPVGNWLTWGAFMYPFAFLVTDLTNRIHGARKARYVVTAGFIVGVLCSFIASQITTDSGDPLTTLRIAIGSGTAFLVAHMIDVVIFDRLRQKTWWRAPFTSSIVGSMIDTILFFSIAFSATFAFIDPNDPHGWALTQVPLLGFGGEFPLWVSLAVADFAVKMSLALFALVPFRFVTVRVA